MGRGGLGRYPRRRGPGQAFAAHDVKGDPLPGLIEVGRSTVKPDIFDINVAGTTSLLMAMVGPRRPAAGLLVQARPSMSQGGRGPLESIPEAAPKAPSSPYGEPQAFASLRVDDPGAVPRLWPDSRRASLLQRRRGGSFRDLSGKRTSPRPTSSAASGMAAGLGDGKPLTVFGEDFGTPDGTRLVRDYHAT